MTRATEFIVMTAAAQMPSSCRGLYRKVAVCEVEAGVHAEDDHRARQGHGPHRLAARSSSTPARRPQDGLCDCQSGCRAAMCGPQSGSRHDP